MKYKLTSNTKQHLCRTLYQITALKDFGDVKKGDLGGWIEKESNLSQDGNSWVYENAKVYGNAEVYGDAKVYENAEVSGNAWVFENALVSGNAWVFENALVSGNAKVHENALVSGNAKVHENAIATKKVLNLNYFEYNITITDNHIQIGCQQLEHTEIKDWKEFNTKENQERFGRDEMAQASKFWDVIVLLLKKYKDGR